MSALPFLIIETGHPVSGMKRYGRFPHWIRVAAGLAKRETVVIDVANGDRLPDRRGFAGTLISGSAAFVTDRADWSERSAEWLRDAAHAGMPLLGICYGHQLIAHALGGQVDYNPAGRESGTIALELHPPAHEDPLFAGLPPQFPAHATHLQTVLRAPDGAVVLARSPQDQCHAFRWGQSTWGVQFHPEFATHHMRGYVRARADCIARHGRCARTVVSEVSAAPMARKLLRRFVHHARGLQTVAGHPAAHTQKQR
ncbi:glutamine amidotransferase [Xanthomonas campestris]|uniref:glutamine amidotransferase n=1 Tax=Xanthomonas campestris TaxID=339 RepID=UPI002B23DB01|nr:glutamine amidotransferase [Xanthomonas campestris]MEA9481955.1 glutamine amidotransferase [Xanthomonas campestris]